ncbi:Versiconal hemiacetal acetate reductase [Trichoderma velutinum]
MEYQRLGRSGLKISRVVLGTMSYGDPEWQQWVLAEKDARPLLKHAYDVGLNTWDTADVYSNGLSEEIVGKALRHYNIPRNEVVIMTKCFFGVSEKEQLQISALGKNDGKWVNRVGLSRKHIFDAVDASVARLGTYIDVLQLHRLDRETPAEEIMKALNDVIESGKVRYIGASSMAAWELQKLQNIAEKNGWHKFISMQNYYNLLYREEEREMVPYCRDAGIGIIPWSPLARGLLTRPAQSPSTHRENTDAFLHSFIRKNATEADDNIVRAVEFVAKKHGVSMAMIAIGWCLSKGACPIIGLNTQGRIDEAVASVRFFKEKGLDKDDITILESAYAAKAPATF